MFLGWAAILIVPVCVWTYLIAEPLTAIDPLNWRLLFSGQFSADGYPFGRGYVGDLGWSFMTLLFTAVLLPIALRHSIIIIMNYIRNFFRFNQLPARVRAAVARLASTPVTPKDAADTTPPSNAAVSIVSDYQPLNKRPPTREILSPFASHFEALLALPGMATVKVVVRPRASHTCYSSTHNP